MALSRKSVPNESSKGHKALLKKFEFWIKIMERFFINEHVEKVRQILIKVLAVVFLLVSFGFLYDFLDDPTENGVHDNDWIIIQSSARTIHFLLWTILCLGIFLKSRKLMLPWLCIWVPTFMVRFYLNSICQLLIFTKS